MDLESTRKKISQVDSEILNLLSRRMELALQTKGFKKGVEDKEREKQVLDYVKKRSHGLISSDFSIKVYQDIISEAKNLQKKNLELVGFQGEHGAYSEEAVMKFSKSGVPMPCAEFGEVFDGVKDGLLDAGIVPVENTLAGAVIPVNDLLIQRDLHVVGEVKVPIRHCLLALPDTDYREIKVVYSHPMALSQCHGIISRQKFEARSYYDTAGAARMLVEERPRAAAVIASKLCADIYGLEILRENIDDHHSNETRFFVLSKIPNKGDGDKCSIIFSTPHKAGALFSVLKVFSDAGINLTRIESRPLRDDPGNFAFLVDFQGSSNDKKVASALEDVKKNSEVYKFLGCYKEAK